MTNFFFKIFYTSRGTTFSMTVYTENDFKGVIIAKNFKKQDFRHFSFIKV